MPVETVAHRHHGPQEAHGPSRTSPSHVSAESWDPADVPAESWDSAPPGCKRCGRALRGKGVGTRPPPWGRMPPTHCGAHGPAHRARHDISYGVRTQISSGFRHHKNKQVMGDSSRRTEPDGGEDGDDHVQARRVDLPRVLPAPRPPYKQPPAARPGPAPTSPSRTCFHLVACLPLAALRGFRLSESGCPLSPHCRKDSDAVCTLLPPPRTPLAPPRTPLSPPAHHPRGELAPRPARHSHA